jgi:hypothetical protein
MRVDNDEDVGVDTTGQSNGDAIEGASGDGDGDGDDVGYGIDNGAKDGTGCRKGGRYVSRKLALQIMPRTKPKETRSSQVNTLGRMLPEWKTCVGLAVLPAMLERTYSIPYALWVTCSVASVSTKMFCIRPY